MSDGENGKTALGREQLQAALEQEAEGRRARFLEALTALLNDPAYRCTVVAVPQLVHMANGAFAVAATWDVRALV